MATFVDTPMFTELHCYPGTFHASSIVATADVSLRETAEMVAVLRRRLA